MNASSSAGLDRQWRDELAGVMRRLLAAAPSGAYDEQALPSYTHGNPLIRYLFWARLRIACRFAALPRGARVLDFGCGSGVLFRHFQIRGCAIVGCDRHLEAATKVCRELGIDADLRSDLPSATDERFDAIFALDVLEHVEDHAMLVSRFLHLLKPSGRVLLSGPTENRLYRLGRAAAGFSGHYHVANIYQIERSFEQNGFLRTGEATLYPLVPAFRVSRWERRGAG